MNVSTSQLARPLPPERWIVCSDPDRDAIKVEIKETTSLYVAWRLHHGLVRFVSPSELATALRQALDGLAPQVHVFHNLGSDEIHQWLGASPDRESRRRLRIQRLTGSSVAPLVSELSRPDGLVEAGWLFGGRQSRPQLANPGQDASFIDKEEEAFTEWSTAFVELYGEDELNAIFSDTAEVVELPNAPEKSDAPSDGPRVLTFPSVPKAAPAPAVAAEPLEQSHELDFDALPLAASSARAVEIGSKEVRHSAGAAPRSKPLMVLELRPSGSRQGRQATDGRVEVWLEQPGSDACPRLKVTVHLWGPRWAGRDDLAVALVPLTQRPLLLRLSKRYLPEGTDWRQTTIGNVQHHSVDLTHMVDLRVVEALRGGTLELFDFTDGAAA